MLAIGVGFFGFVIYVVAGQGADLDALNIAGAFGLVAGIALALLTRRIVHVDETIRVIDLVFTRSIPIRAIMSVEVVNQLEITANRHGEPITIAPSAVEAANLTIFLGRGRDTGAMARIEQLQEELGGFDPATSVGALRIRPGIIIWPLGSIAFFLAAATLAGQFWYPQYFLT